MGRYPFIKTIVERLSLSLIKIFNKPNSYYDLKICTYETLFQRLRLLPMSIKVLMVATQPRVRVEFNVQRVRRLSNCIMTVFESLFKCFEVRETSGTDLETVYKLLHSKKNDSNLLVQGC